MVQICMIWVPRRTEKSAKIAVEEVLIKIKNHFLIREYDGLEGVEIVFQGYQLDRI